MTRRAGREAPAARYALAHASVGDAMLLDGVSR